MSAARTARVRGIIASLFVTSVAAAGLVAMAPAAGAGVDGGGELRCEGGEVGGPAPAEIQGPVAPPDGIESRACAQLEVTKTVTGTPAASPPPGTTYSVVVDCVPVDVEKMRPTGGVEAQQLPEAQSPPFTTTLTFPENGGTQSVFVDRPSDCTVTESPPAGCTLTSIDPGTTEIRDPILYSVDVANNCDPAVEAAPAVVEVPRFTG